MNVTIRDSTALRQVTPEALSAYARAAGWSKLRPYHEDSDIYVGDGLPEVLVPRTASLGDYATAVWDLIRTFADVSEQDELTIYGYLTTADRDVVRVAADGSDDGTLPINDGVELVNGARELLLASACSLREPQPVYRPGANQQAVDLVDKVRFGQTARGSFVVTLLTPTIPPVMTLLADDEAPPIERQLTERLVGTLEAAGSAVERTAAGDQEAFPEAVSLGVSANLCEALVKLIKPFRAMHIGVWWAPIRPRTVAQSVVSFVRADAPILGAAARTLRDRAPRPDEELLGWVRALKRDPEDEVGAIRLATTVDGQKASVAAGLTQRD